MINYNKRTCIFIEQKDLHRCHGITLIAKEHVLFINVNNSLITEYMYGLSMLFHRPYIHKLTSYKHSDHRSFC